MEILGPFDVPLYAILLTVILVVGYIYYTWTFNVWKQAGIPHPRPIPILGTMYTIFQYGYRDVDIKTIEKYGKVHGLYESRLPAIVVGDTEILKEITVKYFSNFTNRRSFPLRYTALELGIVDVKDEHWKLIRSYMTPTFSSGKLRKMTPLIQHAADQFVEKLEDHNKKGEEIRLKDISGNYTMEVIASTGFGIQLNTQKGKNTEFTYYMQKEFDLSPTSPLAIIMVLAPFLVPILDFFGFKLDNVQAMNFLSNVVTKVLEERKAGKTAANNVDFLKLMVDAENEFEISDHDNHSNGDSYTKKRGLTTDEITAQALTFLLGGYETTATTLCLTLYNMAVYPECQEKVFQEIQSVLPGEEEPNYDNISKLHYLDQFIDETLRLYPPASRVDRVASEDMEIKGIKFPKDVLVIIPVMALHTDPDVWPDPYKFDPDRFSPEAKELRDPYYFMPFGVGPRSCVGMRMARMEMKMVIVKALRKFKFVKTSNTPIPLHVDKTSLVLKTIKEPMVRLEQRT